MPRDMGGQARAALENLKRGLEAAGASFADVVTATRFVTDLTDQDALNALESVIAAEPAGCQELSINIDTGGLAARRLLRRQVDA